MRSVAVMPGTLNRQYIIEGMTAGAMYCLGGIGLMLLYNAAKVKRKTMEKILMMIFGGVFFAVAYNVCTMLIRLKMPGYLSAA